VLEPLSDAPASVTGDGPDSPWATTSGVEDPASADMAVSGFAASARVLACGADGVEDSVAGVGGLRADRPPP
jgi:hypothetical protein